MCEDMGAEHSALLYYCNSRWLSRGNLLKRVFGLRKELYCFLLEQKKHFEKFENEVILIKLSYLCDIFEKLNVLNVSLQGNETHILQLTEKITSFKRKLSSLVEV